MARQSCIMFLIVVVCLSLCFNIATTITQINAQDTKWSRQLDTVESPEADSLDWVPLAQPTQDDNLKDRSGNERVLTYSQSFSPNGRFGDFSKAQSAQFNIPYQFQRFTNAQPLRHAGQSLHLKKGGVGNNFHAQDPTPQSFFKFEMPFRTEGLRNNAQVPPALQTGYQIHHSFGGSSNAQSSVFNSPLFNQQPVFPSEFHPIAQKPLAQTLNQPQKLLQQQNFVDDILPLKANVFKESKPLATQQSLQSVSPQVFPVDTQPETLFDLNKPSKFQASFQQQSTIPMSPASHTGNVQQQQEEVQLLYVPYNTLYNQQQSQLSNEPNSNFEANKYNFNTGLPAVNPYQINQFYTQDPLPSENFFTTSTTSRPHITSLKPQNVFQDFVNPPLTTVKPKPKAHQPPLAMFFLSKKTRPSQSDIVITLQNANTISVIDAPTKQIPEIFVGPAGMPIPDGYVKFELPYLSQLAHTHDLRDVPFFVAPLSYRTPNGFNKILLPEPHVGSIVINRAKSTETPNQQELNQYQQPPSTQRTRPSAQRVMEPTTPANDFYQGSFSSTHNPTEATTQYTTQLPQRGNKFSYYYVRDPIQEVNSPKINKQERPKKKRPQTVRIENPTYQVQPERPIDEFNQIGNEKFSAKFQLHQKPSTSTSTTSTSTTPSTSTTSSPQSLFIFTTNPQVEFQSTNGQFYHDFNSAPKAPQQDHISRFTTRPSLITSADEEYRLKQYYRQQEAFRNRPQLLNPTNPPFELVEYTPVSSDYETTTMQTTKGNHLGTVYTPASVPVITSHIGYNSLPQHEGTSEENKALPNNHRPNYNQNEISDVNLEYEPNPYNVPSELPPITPDIPGLVNNLQEKDRQLLTTTTPSYEFETTRLPTRRPIHRTRKPVVAKVSSSVSYSQSERSNKQNNSRTRRPFGTRTISSSNSTNNELVSSTTRRPSSARNPLIRNPNRIRYRPTNEERQSLKLKPMKTYHGTSKKEEDLEYQRDVLKQNYPVFKPAHHPTSPTAIPSSYDVADTESPTSETQQVYTVTPNNNINNNNDQGFPANLLEPMQIAQHYNEFSKDNYGPGYFPNQEDLSPTEPIVRNEVNPIYEIFATTEPTSFTTISTTTEEPTTTTTTTTRRSPFLRRNYPRTRSTTTTETPTTTPSADERPSIRPRVPPRKVIRIRMRTRRPLHSTTSTTPSEDEQMEHVTEKQNLRKLNRFNQDLYENEAPRRRYKHKFKLEEEESQWSPAFKSENANNDNFKPLDIKDLSKTADTHNYANEPEIVTAAQQKTENKPENYAFNVSANLGSTLNRSTLKAPNLRPEKSFAELLEEVMGKVPEEFVTIAPTDSPHTVDYFEAQKTTIVERLPNRRGKWKKNRLTVGQNNESFETAESQNIGSQLYNTLYSGEKSKADSNQLVATTTIFTPITSDASIPVALTTTTPISLNAIDVYDMSTTKTLDTTTIVANDKEEDAIVKENATRRMDVAAGKVSNDGSDDLETQPSLFSEVRKQLHDLFAIEESEDPALTAALAAVSKRRQEYMNIKRTKPTEGTTTIMSLTTEAAQKAITTTNEPANNNIENFHKNLMDNVVYATSTSTKVTSEAEICYRGRCIRSEDLPANHKLH